MSTGDKIQNAAQDALGKGKEAVGKGTDNPRLEAEGQQDQGVADLKQRGEHLKDAFKG